MTDKSPYSASQPLVEKGKEMKPSEETATVRRNILIALLAGMKVYSPEEKLVNILLTFYRASDEEQDRLSWEYRLLLPKRLWDEGGTERFELEESLGLYVSQGSNADLDMDQMVDVGRMVWRVLTLAEPEEANGNMAGLAERMNGWGADGAAFLRKYAELSAATP